MREQLIQYAELLFAGAGDYEDIKQEILQNTLDRYDDLIAEGKVPEAAYRLAITGIGDINEILGTKPQMTVSQSGPVIQQEDDCDTPRKKLMRAIAVGLYILCPVPVLILGSLDSEILNITGVIGLLVIVAVATVLMMLGAKKEKEKEEEDNTSPLGKSISSLIWAIGLAVYFILSFVTQAWHMTWLIFPILGALDQLVKALAMKAEDPDTFFPATANRQLRKGINRILWAVGLIVYFVLSFETMAWYITWILFPIIAAVQGLVNAILDLKEAMEHEA